MPELLWRAYDELERGELYAVLMLRADVFVLEQRSIYRDIDGADADSLHLLLKEEGGRLLGTLRLSWEEDGSVVIGRVALRPDARGKGWGARMMASALAAVQQHAGEVPVFLSAQSVQEGFYRKFGFKRVSEPYDDAGIMHIDMRRDPGPGS